MKRLNVLLAATMMLCIAASTKAQTPQAIKYQAVTRNANGEVITNQNVSFRISIIQGSSDGTPVYQEIQTVTTNQFGLANISIGTGNVVTGQFNTITWGNGTYFAKIEFDPKGGSEYAFMGTSQLLSVPYSLYSEHAKVADNLPVFPIKASLQATNQKAPFDNPETGMLVYNTDSTGTTPNNVVPGYYYNAGTKTNPNWVLLSTDNNTGNTRRVFSTGTNTTYGGTVQGASTANATSAPTGSDNTGYGTNALGTGTNPSGYDNTGIGYTALTSITSGADNTATGSGALYTNSTASYNTANGALAFYYNNGSSNAGTGFQALYKNTSGYNNTGYGAWASYANQTGYNNTASGEGALFNSTGNNNTANGMEALFTNTSGSNNTGLGFNALFYNTTGVNNTAIGYLAMNGYSGSSTGSSNTAMGAYALYSAATASKGSWNTAIGDSALATNSLGTYNTAMGYQCLAKNTTATNNTAIGYQALYTQNYNNAGATYPTDNVAIGYQALFSNQPAAGNVGEQSTAVGDYALYTNTTGNYNTAIGFYALYANATINASENVAVGNWALEDNYSGDGNVATGVGALSGNYSGGSNTAMGDFALSSNYNGNDNIAIGYQAGPTSGSANNTIAIGYQASVSNSNQIEIGNSNNTFCGINGASYNSSYALVVGTGGGNGNGAYCTTGGVWTNASDRNKKENFSVINEEEILQKINALPILRWNYKGEPEIIQHIGPMAQDFYKIFHVGTDSISISTIDPAGIALAGIQALNKKLEKENAELKNQLSEMAKTQTLDKTTQESRLSKDEKQITELKKMMESLSAEASTK